MGEWITNSAWLIPALPLFSFIIVGLFLRPLNEKLAAGVATASIGLAWLSSLLLASHYFSAEVSAEAQKTLIPWTVEWLKFQEGVTVNFGVLLDPISVMMLVVVTTVSFLVHFYSLSYMHGESGYGRYFTYLNLFTFSMLGLVVAPNIFQTYFFWELVGVSSFLLIGFYYQKPSAVAASKKAFIVTRFADLGFFIGILILGYFGFKISGEIQTGSQPLDYAFLTHPEVLKAFLNLHLANGNSLLALALLLVFMGAAGKSAMFPLHIWLPDAMEGPTPVSALIHAATMVVAGVYLVARLFPVFSTVPDVLTVIAGIGLFTSAFAAIIACTQDDIKRVLAFSTLSQLGYMMFSLGLATMAEPLGYTASMFHLFTHAFFKALLFLGAGSIIHAVHSNDVWEMGGLKKKMPITHITFAMAVLAIAGIWPFSGFFSKDEILATALHGEHYVHFIGGLLVAGLTAFYMARIYFLSFWGKARTEKSSHAHESSWVMLAPLGFLALLSLTTGFIPFAEFVKIGAPLQHEGIDLHVAIPGTLMALLGLSLSAWMYTGTLNVPKKISVALGQFYVAIKNKFYVDEVYSFITHQIIFRFVAAPVAWFDRNVVDGGVNLTGAAMRGWSSALTLIQTGQLQTYLLWFVFGTVTASLLLWGIFLGMV